jgi:hypothetical protein
MIGLGISDVPSVPTAFTAPIVPDEATIETIIVADMNKRNALRIMFFMIPSPHSSNLLIGILNWIVSYIGGYKIDWQENGK